MASASDLQAGLAASYAACFLALALAILPQITDPVSLEILQRIRASPLL